MCVVLGEGTPKLCYLNTYVWILLTVNFAGEQIHHSHSHLNFYLHELTIYLVKSNSGDRLNIFLPVTKEPVCGLHKPLQSSHSLAATAFEADC